MGQYLVQVCDVCGTEGRSMRLRRIAVASERVSDPVEIYHETRVPKDCVLVWRDDIRELCPICFGVVMEALGARRVEK